MILDECYFHPKIDCRKYPIADDSRTMLFSSKIWLSDSSKYGWFYIHPLLEHYLWAIIIQYWMNIYGSFSSVFGFGTYLLSLIPELLPAFQLCLLVQHWNAGRSPTTTRLIHDTVVSYATDHVEIDLLADSAHFGAVVTLPTVLFGRFCWRLKLLIPFWLLQRWHWWTGQVGWCPNRKLTCIYILFLAPEHAVLSLFSIPKWKQVTQGIKKRWGIRTCGFQRMRKQRKIKK